MAPALGQKDEAKQEKKEGEEKPNPFLNPNPALVVKELDNHIMLLNKFAVTPNHLLIVTKGKSSLIRCRGGRLNPWYLEYKKQTEPILPDELYETFKTIKDFGSSQPTLVFYNCGPNSGAR